jgi:hypothetical protein
MARDRHSTNVEPSRPPSERTACRTNDGDIHYAAHKHQAPLPSGIAFSHTSAIVATGVLLVLLIIVVVVAT